MSAQFRAHGRATVRANLANNEEILTGDSPSPPADNPVGSREVGSLTASCRDVLVGTILGDGCLERNGRNVRLRIDHGAVQEELVSWKFQQLAELNPSRVQLVERIDLRTGNLHRNLRFKTGTTERLNDLYDLFYAAGGEKGIPKQIKDLLTSILSLAVWYMDDGGRRSDCASGYFNTNAYEVADVQLLQDVLRENFDVGTKMHFAAGKPRIYIPKGQFQVFCDLIRGHVIPSMQYKLL